MKTNQKAVRTTDLTIELSSVSKRFHDIVVFSDLNLNLTTGLHLIYGPNGVGKSTLIHLLCGLEKADEGTILIHKLNIKNQTVEINRVRTYLPDHPSFYENATVQEIIETVLAIRGLTPSEIRLQIETWELSSLLEKQWKELSFGQKKRTFAAMSLLPQVPIWILDEPSNGLDQEWLPRLAQVLNQSKTDHLILFSSHDQTLIQLVEPQQLQFIRQAQKTEISSKKTV